MDEAEVAALAAVGVGIGGVGLAVGGPAGVGDADGAGGVLGSAFLLEGRHFAGGLVDVEVAAGGNHGDAGRVVAAIFKTMEAFDQDGAGLLLPDVSYNSAHHSVYKWCLI